MPAGKPVLVQHKGNLATDVTDLVHPEVEARAVDSVVGLDMARSFLTSSWPTSASRSNRKGA